MAYRAAVVEAGDDRAALIKLWTENLPVGADPAAKLRWAYVDSPSGPGEAFLLRDDHQRAIGCAGVGLRELVYRGAPIRAALLADFAIDRAHRSGLPALVLQRAVKRHVEAGYDLSYGFPNANAVAIHVRTGYHELGKMKRYVRVLRHAAYLERRFGYPVLARAGGAAIDAAKLAVHAARAAPILRTHALAWPGDVDARFDDLWQRARHSLPIACRRDAAFLRWRFLRKFDERAVIATAVERATGRLAAYAIVHGARGELAEIRDLLGADLASLGALLRLLVPALALRGHTAISVRFLGDPRITALLEAHHFAPRGAERAIIVHAGPRCPIPAATLHAAASWYITDLDEDT